MAEKYIATGNIKHNTIKYAYGDKIELTKGDAQLLLENNVIETPAGFKRLEAMKNISPATVEELEKEIERLKTENGALQDDLKAANDTIAVLQSKKQEESDEADKE